VPKAVAAISGNGMALWDRPRTSRGAAVATQMIFMQVFDAKAFAGGLLLVFFAALAAGLSLPGGSSNRSY